MVCKENVVSWFRNLSSHKRIDVMCSLLNMCLPFEVRYLGTYVEDRGRRDYNDLRDTEHHANNPSDLNELSTLGVGDTRTRRKLILYMALLHGCNYTCAIVLYKSLANLDVQEINSILSGASFNQDEQPLEELLLLYTMALNHPAFTYEQKTTFGNIFLMLQDEEARLNLSKSGCDPCILPNDRLLEGAEIPANCTLPPSPMQQYPDVPMRNPIMTGVPPGLTMPPPGLCMPPGTEQLTMGASNPQYLPLGFPSTVSPLAPWPNQTVMMTQVNPMIYPSEIPGYPTSPLMSRQSSPSQSRSPSRSNSPSRRSNNGAQRWSFDERKDASNQSLPSPMTSAPSSQPSAVVVSGATGHVLPSRSVPSQPRVPTRESSTTYSRHNSLDSVNVATAPSSDKCKQPPPPRLRSSVSGDSVREGVGKEMPNFKGNLQNYSREEIRKLSDEDLRDFGLTPNAVGQLRSIVRSQTANGLSSQVIPDKKLEAIPTHHPAEPLPECEIPPNCEIPENCSMKPSPPAPQQLPELYQPILHHHHHHHNSHNIGGMRRCYPTMPPIDPNQIPNVQPMYTPPPALFPAQNHCYACLTVPVSGMQARYPRCNAQHMYCLAQLQTLRLDADGSRQCSQSSSSDSTGSRSPPETPPAAPWVSANTTVCSTTVPASTPSASSPSTTAPIAAPAATTATTATTTPISSDGFTIGTPVEHNAGSMIVPHQTPGQLPPMTDRPRNTKRSSHMMRQKNQMMNGAPPVNMAPCVSAFPVSGPSVHSQMTFLPHGHVSLRPNTGIYPNFTGYRPNYPPSYQPNGEIMFPYPPPATGGTPPPSTLPPSTVAVVVPTPSPQSYMPPAPAVPFTAAVQQAKISCYNCGSSSHLAGDCKDQTMEDLTKRAPYRLDYAAVKQPSDCSSDK